MACRSCSAGLGQLPKRLAGPLRHNVVASAPLQQASALCAVPLALAFATPRQTTTARITTRTTRRALHTTPPRQKLNLNLKEMLRNRIARSLAAGHSSYFIYGATERVYKICASQADYTIDVKDRKAGTLKATADGEEIGTSKGGPWHDDLALLPTFSTWAHVTMLHMYLMVVRFRCLHPDAQAAWQAALVNHFFYQAEARMEDVHELTSGMIRQQYLKDLFVQWRGLILAYDEGLVKGDAVLASAVWRNLFKAREDVDVRSLAAVVGWMRSGLRELGEMEDAEIQEQPERAFEGLVRKFATVDVPTASMKAVFQQAGMIEP